MKESLSAIFRQHSGIVPRHFAPRNDNLEPFRGSSNGRTAAFEAVNHGSNPCPRANRNSCYLAGVLVGGGLGLTKPQSFILERIAFVTISFNSSEFEYL